MGTKTNYERLYLEEVLSLGGKRPTLLLHSCCGPCSTFPLTYLAPHFDVTVYYSNSNIFPQEEYTRRLGEQKRFLEYLKRDYGYEVGLVVPAYDHDAYMEELRPLAGEREGGNRCRLCYEKRMKEGYDYAEAHGFDYFATLMTVSRQKDSQVLNEIGEKLSKEHAKTRYLFSDFKKDNGNQIGNRLAVSYGLYRQDYCGCEYSSHGGHESLDGPAKTE